MSSKGKYSGATIMPTKLPAGTAAKVKKWAAEAVAMRVIARRLGITERTFRSWMDTFPDLRAAYGEGVEAEHQMLYKALLKHLDKSPVPAIFLLKARHGYREGDQTETINRVSITFDLPGAMPLKAYMKAQPARTIEHKPDDSAED